MLRYTVIWILLQVFANLRFLFHFSVINSPQHELTQRVTHEASHYPLSPQLFSVGKWSRERLKSAAESWTCFTLLNTPAVSICPSHNGRRVRHYVCILRTDWFDCLVKEPDVNSWPPAPNGAWSQTTSGCLSKVEGRDETGWPLIKIKAKTRILSCITLNGSSRVWWETARTICPHLHRNTINHRLIIIYLQHTCGSDKHIYRSNHPLKMSTLASLWLLLFPPAKG